MYAKIQQVLKKSKNRQFALQSPLQILNCLPANFEPYLQRFVHNDCSIFSFNNSGLRQMYSRNLPDIQSLPASVDTARFKRFLRISIPGRTRNLWYCLLHNKISCKSITAAILQLPDDKCGFCGLTQTPEHMLFTCTANKDIWTNAINLFFEHPSRFSLSQLYLDVIALNIDHYQLLDTHLRLN
ncbi:uncharacterized protein B0P05DRAFT_143083 [Gilbertella persicaria]|uniref:uncharacterized protein n=1 Tax=Gilbertella persicaria TaxID=101096 RepID=UPI00221F54AA|nr:uncharacterized protein B0P05DRAFT_143083 [Gilbertella persicaria]KAI8076542.1 hypothetical protein B0P05DRAFT_143083 [Gilbertella persicaria]